MSADGDLSGENFLARWSRLKTSPVEEAAKLPEQGAAAPAGADESEAPALPPVEELTMESDFRGFLHPKVNEDVRRAALRKLFSDPHFNIMDGLDVYIDDYTKADPIPPEMLAGLMQAQRIFGWAQEKEEQKPGTEAADTPAQAPAALPARTDAESTMPEHTLADAAPTGVPSIHSVRSD
jgi:hypothetical protein